MGSKHQLIRSLLTDAIIELCRREAFYVEELRIEGTLCIVSDRSSVLVTQITEQIGEKCTEEGDRSLPLLNYERESSAGASENNGGSSGGTKSTYVKVEERKGESGDSARFIDDLVIENERKDEKEEQRKRDHQQMMNLMPKEKTNGKYKCPFCPKAYGFKHNLKDHINKHTGRKPHVCKYCGMSFTFLASLCGHIKRCHFHCMPREHQCQICGNRFPNRQSLRQHFTWRHSPQKIVQKLELKLSQQRNSPPKFNQESQRDVRTGADGKPMFEEVKGDARKAGNDGNMYQQHSVVVKPDPEPGKGRPDNSGLEEMDLSQALGLSQPSQGPNPNLGPLMGMRMSLLQASTMSFPMFPPRQAMPHYTMSPNPAAKCQMSLPKPTDSKEQQSTPELFRSSTGKFHCPYCEKAYRFKHTLKDHINTHFGKRPHVCKYCNDAFTHFASLCAHIKRRHKEHIPRDFACTICNENFMNLQSLKQHFTWRHKDSKLPLNLPAQYGSNPGRKLNSGPEIPQWSSPMTTSTVTGSPHPSSSNAVPPMSNLQSSPSQLHSPTEMLFSPASPTLPSMDAFIKGGGSPFPGFAHNVFPEPVKDLMGAMNRESHSGTLFSPMGLLSPQGNAPPPGSCRENFN